MKKLIFIANCLLFSIYILFSQSHISPQAHQESVSAIANASSPNALEKVYFSAGNDGFIVKWTGDNQGEHYQISDLEIRLIAKSPVANEIAVYETDGGLINRVSVWNWETLTRKYARRFKSAVSSLQYSKKGNYLIVGTATVDGTVFLRAMNGQVVNKIPGNTGIVSMIETTDTEKTALFYSPTGNISYYNLETGRLKKKFSCEQSLEQPVLFNNYMFLSGVKDGQIYIIHALSGETLLTTPAENPLLLVSSIDANLYYLSNDNKGSYTLFSIDNIDNKSVSQPRIIKNYKGPRASQAISCGAKNGSEIILGSKSGAIYKTDSVTETEMQTLVAITENTYDKILDMATIGEDFYFLTKDSLFKSSYDTGMVDKKGENSGYTNIITYGDKVILWSKGTTEEVVLFDYNSNTKTPLFTPTATLQTLRLFGNKIIEMESNSLVNLFDMDTKNLTEIYTGAGLQDAVIASDGRLYVAKSSATNPRSSLLAVDLETRETVPINLGGNVAFALNINANDIYGVYVQASDVEKSTVVFKYNPSSKLRTAILRLKDEDPEAWTYLHYPILYTNIGKDNVRSCNLTTNKNFVFKRSASIPVKALQNANRVVILNKDGSISWYNTNLSQVLADWYLTQDGQWFEF